MPFFAVQIMIVRRWIAVVPYIVFLCHTWVIMQQTKSRFISLNPDTYILWPRVPFTYIPENDHIICILTE